VAKKLKRKFLGYELSEEYSQSIRKRLAKIQPGDALDGTPEPLVSAPDTANGCRLEDRKMRSAAKKTGPKKPARNNSRKPTAAQGQQTLPHF